MNTKMATLRGALCALVLLGSSNAWSALFDAGTDDSASAWFRSVAENALGFSLLTEGAKAVEKALNRDEGEVRLQRIMALEQDLRKLRDEKNAMVKQIDLRRKSVILAAGRVRSGEHAGDVSPSNEDVAKRLLAAYEDRLQCINGLLGIWAAMPGVLEGHIAFLQSQADEVTRLSSDFSNRSTYKIGDYQDLDVQIEEIGEQIKKTLSSRKAAASERESLLNRVAFLKRELELKAKELDFFGGSKPYVADASEDRETLSRADRYRVLQEESELTRDKIALSELKIRKLDLEQAEDEDEVASLKIRASRLNNLVAKVKRGMVIDAEDVARAKAEKNAQDAQLAAEKERIRGTIHEKTFERERVREHHESLKSALSNLRAMGKEGTYESAVVQAREWLDKNLIKALDAQIQLLGLDDDYAHAEAGIKGFQFKSIDIRYRLVTEDSRIGSWLEEIVNSKRLLENDLAKYQAQKNDAISSITHMQEELDRLKKKQLEFSEGEHSIFVGHDEALRNTLQFIAEAKEAVKLQIAQTQKFVTRAGEVLRLYQRLLKQYMAVIGELEAKRVSVNIWRRSARGISVPVLLQAFDDGQNFCKNLFWKTHDFFDTTSLFRRITFLGLFGLCLFALLYWMGFLVTRGLLVIIRRRIQLFTSYQKGNFVFWYLNVVLLFFDAVQRQFPIFYGLLFVYLQIKLKATYYGFFTFANEDYALAAFYLIAAGIWTYLCSDFLSELRTLNIRLSYFFFSERNQRRILSLVSLLLHSTALIFPFRSALMAYGLRYESLPSVLFAAYSLVVIISLALLFDKDDLLSLIPGRGDHWQAIRGLVDAYFYPGFFFLILLFVLANPYVGYSQLAWYLAFFVPISICVLIFSSWIYGSLRRQVLWVFVDERDDGLEERFEYAKVYYGFFVTLSFLSLLFLIVGALSQIWGLPYNLTHLWSAVADDWVFLFNEKKCKFGLIEVMSLYTFIVGGYIASTFVNRFVLSKILEVFGAEPGMQNTSTRILHVLVLLFAFALGCGFIGAGDAVKLLLLVIGFAVLFGAKDLVADFVAGLLILLERQIEIGHYISADGYRGTVYRISARSTIIRTAQNYFVVIPNRNLISHAILNWGAGRYSVGFELTVTTGFESDPDVVLEILRRVLNAHPLILRVPAISVRLENFTQSGADFFIRAFVSIRKVKEQWEIASDVRVAIYKAFREKGIVFPYPRLIMYQSENKPEDPSSFFKFKFDNDVGHQEVD